MLQEPDLVTIYLCSVGRIDLLRRAVNSVLSQSYTNIELVVVLDGVEDDRGLDILNSQRIRVIRNSRRMGAQYSRNRALDVASGRFVTGLDDDDWFEAHRISSFVEAWNRLEASGQKFSGLFDAAKVVTPGIESKFNLLEVVSAADILTSNAVGNQFFTLRDRFLVSGGFDLDMPAWQDWDLWIRIILDYGPAHNIQKTSMNIDQSHSYERVSSRTEFKRRALNRMFSKYELSLSQRTSFLQVYSHSNPRDMSISELALLLLSLKFICFSRSLIKRFGVDVDW